MDCQGGFAEYKLSVTARFRYISDKNHLYEDMTSDPTFYMYQYKSSQTAAAFENNLALGPDAVPLFLLKARQSAVVLGEGGMRKMLNFLC